MLGPEDPYPVWCGDGVQAVVVPLSLLWDYRICAPGMTKEDALAEAHRAGAVCADESLLHRNPVRARRRGTSPASNAPDVGRGRGDPRG